MKFSGRCVIALSLALGVSCADFRLPWRTNGAGAPNVAEVAPAQFGPAPARIRSVNSQHKFIVIDFTSQPMPTVGTPLTVYRDGQRVGAVRITEPVRAQFATADIIEGELQVGDEVR